MNFMQVKVTHTHKKKAKHGRSAIQANLVFCCGDMSNSGGKIQPQIFSHSVFLANALCRNQQFPTFPRGLCNMPQIRGVNILLLIKLTVSSTSPPHGNCPVVALVTTFASQLKLWTSLHVEVVSTELQWPFQNTRGALNSVFKLQTLFDYALLSGPHKHR